MVEPDEPRMIGTREILKVRENEKYEVEYSFCEGRHRSGMSFVNVFKKCEDGAMIWLRGQRRGYESKESGKDRYHDMVIKYIIGAETWSQFGLEIIGVLGKRIWTGEERLDLLAKNQAVGIVVSYFELEEEDIIVALKQLQAKRYLQNLVK